MIVKDRPTHWNGSRKHFVLWQIIKSWHVVTRYEQQTGRMGIKLSQCIWQFSPTQKSDQESVIQSVYEPEHWADADAVIASQWLNTYLMSSFFFFSHLFKADHQMIQTFLYCVLCQFSWGKKKKKSLKFLPLKKRFLILSGLLQTAALTRLSCYWRWTCRYWRADPSSHQSCLERLSMCACVGSVHIFCVANLNGKSRCISYFITYVSCKIQNNPVDTVFVSVHVIVWCRLSLGNIFHHFLSFQTQWIFPALRTW